MSVVKSKKEQSTLLALDKAYFLLEYTFQICVREKTDRVYDDVGNYLKVKTPIFPKKYWSSITSKIIEDANEIYMNIFTANQITLNESTTEEMFKERNDYQNKAIILLNRLSARVSFAINWFSLSNESAEYWAKMIVETLDLTRAWKKSDEYRFKKFKK